MKMTTYLQALVLATSFLPEEATVNKIHARGFDWSGWNYYSKRGQRRIRQSIKFYDKVAKLTHAYDAAAERRAAIDPDDQLSLRELEVVKCVADGFSDKEIGALLCISHKTVKSHLVSISGKLCAAGRVDIVITALQRGLIELPKEKECLPF